jgi:hypothetical protein
MMHRSRTEAGWSRSRFICAHLLACFLLVVSLSTATASTLSLQLLRSSTVVTLLVVMAAYNSNYIIFSMHEMYVLCVI